VAEKKDDWSEEKTQRFELRITPSFLTIVDGWRRKQDDLPSRAEAIRRLVEIGAGAKAEKRPRK
jgi:hypothetical protein